MTTLYLDAIMPTEVFVVDEARQQLVVYHPCIKADIAYTRDEIAGVIDRYKPDKLVIIVGGYNEGQILLEGREIAGHIGAREFYQRSYASQYAHPSASPASNADFVEIDSFA